jgi:hypothetical protein
MSLADSCGLRGCSWGHAELSTSGDGVCEFGTVSAKSQGWPAVTLPWSHQARLLSVADAEARRFCECEAAGTVGPFVAWIVE